MKDITNSCCLPAAAAAAACSLYAVLAVYLWVAGLGCGLLRHIDKQWQCSSLGAILMLAESRESCGDCIKTLVGALLL